MTNLNKADGECLRSRAVVFLFSKVSKEVTVSKTVTSLYKLWVSNFLHCSEMLQM